MLAGRARTPCTTPGMSGDQGPKLWYGGAGTLAEATPIAVREGETTKITVRLP